jgi:Xaa-Pro aminopeptidase
VDHALRRDRLSARLSDLEVEALLVTRLVNVRYLTGFTGSNAQLLLGEEPVFFTDSRYEAQAGHEVPDLRRTVYPQRFVDAFAEACRGAGIARVGFEAAGVTYETYGRLAEVEGLELVPTSAEVERLRWEKEPDEVRLIGEAQRLTDEAFEKVIGNLAEGVTEREVAFELEQAMRRAGAERLAFESIVAFGEQAAEPHHNPTDRTLRRGDVVKMDFGCVVDGYHSDMTRTVAFGEPSSELREVYDLVARAQGAGIEAVRAGVSGGDADAASRRVIEEAGHGERFGHSLGHGVGLEIHEGPTLRKGSEDVLPEGTVVTVEPGVYLPGVGGVRIEDMVVVEANGCRPLPTTTKELIVL